MTGISVARTRSRSSASGSVQVWFACVQPDRTGPVIRHADATCRRDPSPYPYHSPNPSRQPMAKDYRRLWEDVTSTNDEGEAVRTLAEILRDKEGRTFISNLERRDAELCIETLDHVSHDPYLFPSRRLRWFRQGLAEHNLKTAEKQAFFVTLRRLAAIHGRLPESMMIAEDLKVSDKIVASGGFADIRIGTYMGHLVAVKNVRATEQDGFLKTRKVSINDVFRPLGMRFRLPFSSNFAKKLSSGTRCPIRTS